MHPHSFIKESKDHLPGSAASSKKERAQLDPRMQALKRSNQNREKRRGQESKNKMIAMSKQNAQSFNAIAKKLENRAPPPKGLMGALVHLLVAVMLMGAIGVVNGKHLETETPLDEKASNATALYILGDSSVDCRDNSLFYPLLHRNLSLYPCNGSDSNLLPHLLAEKMGLQNIPPFYNQNGSIEELLLGLNFGSAEATIMNPSSRSHQSLNQQLRQVFETLQLLQLQLGESGAERFVRSSAVYLSLGKDDYIDLFLRNSSGVMLKFSSQEFARILVNQMVHVIRNLYNANFRKIICVGILPLGCAPRTVWEWRNASAGEDDGRRCVKEINEMVLEYNRMLDDQIVELNSKLLDVQIVFCDVYQGIMKILANPRLYGFEDRSSACCGVGLYGAMIGCLSPEMACNQASTYVWWDLYNPTPAVYSLLVDSAWSGRPFYGMCRPTTIQELLAT